MSEIKLSDADFQEYKDWWVAGGALTRGGLPKNTSELWSDDRFLDWFFNIKYKIPVIEGTSLSLGEYLQSLYKALIKAGNSKAQVSLRMQDVYSKLPAIAQGTSKPSILPLWVEFSTAFETDLANTIQAEGEKVAGNAFLWNNQLFNVANKKATPYASAEADRILKKFYGDDTLARERFEFEKEKVAKGELAAGRKTMWDIQQAAKTEARLARSEEVSAADRAENRAWQREQAAGTRAFQQAQLGIQAEERYAAMKARPSNWIQAWYQEHAPRLQTIYPIQRQAQQGIPLLQEPRGVVAPENWNISPIQRRAQEGMRLLQETPGYVAPEYWSRIPPASQIYPYLPMHPEFEALREEFGPAIEAQQEQAAQAQATGYRGGGTPRVPSAPPTPQWLSTLTGQPAGSEMVMAPLKTASYPYWQSMSPTQRQMLGGYQEWRGLPNTALEDYQALVQSMLPKRSQQARWQPQRQWA